MYLLPAIRAVLLLAAATMLAGLASAQIYDQYGQPVRHTTRVAPVVHRQTHYRTTVVVRHRPFSHSVAIVGGSALAGAGVGALVGGPPGAIVGALTGGVGGLIYDRKTHRKRYLVRRRVSSQ